MNRKSGTFEGSSLAHVERFTNALDQNRARAKHLAGADPTQLADDPILLQETIEHLRLQREELEVASEELRAQLDDLDRSSVRLQAERERYRALFDFAPDAVFVTDTHGVIREVNAAAADLLSVEARYLRGKPLATFIVQDDKFQFRAMLRRVCGGEASCLDTTIEGRDGTRVEVSMRCGRAHDGRGLLFSARVAAPFSDRFSLVPASMDDSAQMARTLQGELQNKDKLLDEARHTQLALEQANAAKDQSLAILSHELRSPMQAILGWTRLLREDGLDEATREKGLKAIERSCRMQSSLIESLFDLSQLVADKLDLNLELVDFSGVADHVIEMMAAKANEEGIALHASIDRDVRVMGDHLRLHQLLTNLLSNALRYSSSGTHVTVTLHIQNSQAELVVSDQGIGIGADMLERIFECFQRGTEDHRKGLGLGLFLVRGFTHRHGGTVHAESAGLGQGARFIVRIPVASERG